MRLVEVKGFLFPHKLSLAESNRVDELRWERKERNKAKLFKKADKRQQRQESKSKPSSIIYRYSNKPPRLPI